MATTDPYYWSRDIMTKQNQDRALGRQGLSADELTKVVGANFSAQQQNEVTQTNLQLAKDASNRADAAANESKHETARAGERQGIMGAAQLAVSTPIALWSAKALIGSGAQAATTGATTTSAGSGVVTTGAGATTTEASATGAGAGTVALEAGGGVGVMAVGAAASNWAARELNLPGNPNTWGAAGGLGPAMVATTLLPLAIGKDIWDAVGRSVGTPHANVNLGPVHASSIICTELNRQGLLSSSMLRASSLYIGKHRNEPGKYEFYRGYLIFAAPIVERMKKSKFMTLLMKPYGEAICREIASKETRRYKSTIIGRIVFSLSGLVFRWIYDNSVKGASHVIA